MIASVTWEGADDGGLAIRLFDADGCEEDSVHLPYCYESNNKGSTNHSKKDYWSYAAAGVAYFGFAVESEKLVVREKVDCL